MRRHLSLLLLMVVGATGAASAATITVGPTDCTAAAVQTAITSAASGDTVLLTCTGTQTWTSTVTIPDTKGITLQVQGGTNTPKASANFPLTISSSADPIMIVILENSRPVTRITGFKFTNTIASTSGAIYFRGRGTGAAGTGAFRLDNNYFDQIQLPHNSIEGTVTVYGLGSVNPGVITGLIDNNTFHDTSYEDGYAIALAEWFRYPSTASFDYSGGHAWARPLGWGTSDFIFIEDNAFENVARYTRHYVAAFAGAKYVFRFNTTSVEKSGVGSTDAVDAHGWCHAGIGEGTRGGEIYGNTFAGSQRNRDMVLRGGAWLVYNNTFVGASNMVLFEYRADPGLCTQCATSMTSATGWKQCLLANGSDYPAQEQIGADITRASTPTYFWNNVVGTTQQSPGLWSAATGTYVVLNRDYFVSTNQPAALSTYTAYPYPHPLRGGTAPTNFTLALLGGGYTTTGAVTTLTQLAGPLKIGFIHTAILTIILVAVLRATSRRTGGPR